MKAVGSGRLPVEPERTCLGCGARDGKGNLLRFVARDGSLVVDPTQRLSGRGVYCCSVLKCLKKFAAKKGRLSRALRAEVADCQAITEVIVRSSMTGPAGFGGGA